MQRRRRRVFITRQSDRQTASLYTSKAIDRNQHTKTKLKIYSSALYRLLHTPSSSKATAAVAVAVAAAAAAVHVGFCCSSSSSNRASLKLLPCAPGTDKKEPSTLVLQQMHTFRCTCMHAYSGLSYAAVTPGVYRHLRVACISVCLFALLSFDLLLRLRRLNPKP